MIITKEGVALWIKTAISKALVKAVVSKFCIMVRSNLSKDFNVRLNPILRYVCAYESGKPLVLMSIINTVYVVTSCRVVMF
jgi:hypothetical protein